MSNVDSAFSSSGSSSLATLAVTVLMLDRLPTDTAALQVALRRFDSEMSLAEVTPMDSPKPTDVLATRIKWGRHNIDVAGLDVPAPRNLLDQCIMPGHYPEPVKRQAYTHRTHLLLYHVGPEVDPIERSVALSAVAGTLHQFGAIAGINEIGHISISAQLLCQSLPSGRLAFLRSIPLPLFYIGLVKYNLPGTRNVWMRTHGAETFGVPDLATMTQGHSAGEAVMTQFDLILRYMIVQKAKVIAGNTMQVGSDNLRFRHASASDPGGAAGPSLLVIDKITAEAINKPTGVDARVLNETETAKVRSLAKNALDSLPKALSSDSPETIMRAIDEEFKKYKSQNNSLLAKLTGNKPKVDPLALANAFGALWGEQVVRRFAWQWVIVTRNGKRCFAVASPDRAIAISAIDYITVWLAAPSTDFKLKSCFENIATSRLPHLSANGYIDVLG